MTIDQLFMTVFALLLLICVGLWGRVLRQWRARKPVVPARSRDWPALGLLDVALMFVCWLGGQLVMVGWASAVCGFDMQQPEGLTPTQRATMIGLIAGGQLLGTLLGLAIVSLRHRPWNLLKVSVSQIGEGIWLGVCGFLLVVPPILLLQLVLSHWVPYQHATFDVLNSDSPWQSFAFTWFGAVLSAPICEEIFFRGILQDWLVRIMGREKPSIDSLMVGTANPWLSSETKVSLLGNGDRQGCLGPDDRVDRVDAVAPVDRGALAAVTLGALLFGLVHVGQGLAPIPLFFFGLALGYLYYRTGNIIACIVLHVLLNSFSMFWYSLQVLNT